ncbi:fructose-6-phosphate aldolase [Candidatus Cytomitobacter indipagum]|uniref:Fructose-6-phosphate aldolase n=1 Tax=Candidatus Cytomitobacter indipagum TaxID=2601575 RepID=A0A5C0UFJ7_9PROT|nr:transaldolase family protein [Candidatus Cytomitobacter indipagum]QEK38032.1 fructose-6-phosphate aldolase [Candidatus Cytomitobacter indipagum]
MMIFADSANLDDILPLSKAGLINGITTNPKLLQHDMNKAIKISEMTGHKVSYQLKNYDEFIDQIGTVFQNKDKIILKIPSHLDYFKQVGDFIRNGLDVNVTLAFNVNQAILAANLGAKYVSLFVGRLEDNNEDPFKTIQTIRSIYDKNNIQTQIIAASIRNRDHVEKSAAAGAHIATISTKIIESLFNHQLTHNGIVDFGK